MIRSLARFALLLAALVALPAVAVGDAFDQQKFGALMKAGKPTLVAIHADWCPTCRAQALILDDLLKTAPMASITTLRVDFDKQPDAVKTFKGTMQSTLIVFKNGHEVGRSVGDTRRDGIEALLKRAI
jgi:thioredoxin 1